MMPTRLRSAVEWVTMHSSLSNQQISKFLNSRLTNIFQYILALLIVLSFSLIFSELSYVNADEGVTVLPLEFPSKDNFAMEKLYNYSQATDAQGGTDYLDALFYTWFVGRDISEFIEFYHHSLETTHEETGRRIRKTDWCSQTSDENIYRCEFAWTYIGYNIFEYIYSEILDRAYIILITVDDSNAIIQFQCFYRYGSIL